jgi:hypothetical protein
MIQQVAFFTFVSPPMVTLFLGSGFRGLPFWRTENWRRRGHPMIILCLSGTRPWEPSGENSISLTALIRLLAVSLSSSGDWIVCACEILVGDNSLYLWGPFHQEFSARFKGDIGMIDCCCVTINTSQDRLCGAILCGDEKHGYETYEWALSGSSNPNIIITPSTLSEDVVSELRHAQQGSPELLLQSKHTNMLDVRKAAAIDRVARCTCKAAAVFDCWIHAHRAWIELNAQGGAFARAAPKVAVGLADGTVHFMELRGDEETEMFLHERARHELDSQRSTPTAMMLPEHTSGMVLQTASHFGTKQIELSTATSKQLRFCRRKAAERCVSRPTSTK